MTWTSGMSLRAAPVDEANRIASLDVLRGVAVLGILLLNIWSFGLPQLAYSKPDAMGELTGADYWAWYFTFLLGDYKFVTLFSLLFGAGVVLMTDRAEAADRDSAPLHFRRMFWLALIGAAHGYLIWHGDILFIYAVCGFVIYFMKDWPVGRLMLTGFLLIAGGSLLSALEAGLLAADGAGWLDVVPGDAAGDLASSEPGSPDDYRYEIEAFRGSWLTQMSERVQAAINVQLAVISSEIGPRTVGVMTIGMALMRTGLLSGSAPAALFALISLGGFIIGLPLVHTAIEVGAARGWDVFALRGLSHQYNYWGSLFTAAGWMGLVLMICRTGWMPAVQVRLGAVGRMAFTNYLMQSVMATLIFYGHGLGFFAMLGRAELLIVVIAIWTAQLLWSKPWLQHFRFGPMEWLWRSLTYGRLQPLRR